jgi:hypothetical protein
MIREKGEKREQSMTLLPVLFVRGSAMRCNSCATIVLIDY